MRNPIVKNFAIYTGVSQVAFISLKAAEIGEAGRWSWVTVFSPVLIATAVTALIMAGYFIAWQVSNEKPGPGTYTSNTWQEKLAEMHSRR